jgi:O-antigen/teichoic acid export membrane protein
MRNSDSARCKRAGFGDALKGGMLTALAQGAKLASAFCVLKLIAFYLGPEGLGQIANYMSLVSIVSVLAGGGVLHATTSYIASAADSPRRLVHVISTVISYAFITSCGMLLLALIFSHSLALFIFQDSSLWWAVIALFLANFIFSFNVVYNGIVSGFGRLVLFSKSQLVGALIAIPVGWALIALYGFNGALVTLLIMVSSPFFYAVFTKNVFKILSVFSVRYVKCQLVFGLLSYALMLIVSAAAFPLTEIFVRNILIERSGYLEAGIWQGGIRLSSAYMSLIGVFLGVYFLPKISKKISTLELHKAVYQVQLIVAAILLGGGTVLVLGRHLFIPLLLSHDFGSLENLIIYQVIADVFKGVSMVIGFLLIAKSATKLYILCEVFQSLMFLLLVFFLPIRDGAEGVMISYMLTCALYCISTFAGYYVWKRRALC